MSLELRQSLKLSQQLVITQQIQQAIHLLQLNHLEMVQEIQQEMVENPALEEIPGTAPDDSLAGEPLQSEALGHAASRDEADEPQDGPGIDWERVLDGYSSDHFKRATGAPTSFDELPPIEANLVRETTLADHLLWQLRMQELSPEEFRAAEHIVFSLDNRGYLQQDLESIARDLDLPLEVVEHARSVVQGLDPTGCGSRDLEECLLVQARQLFPEDPYLPEIIQRHLGNIERRNYTAIARDLGIDVEDAVEYHRMIRRMEPIPGRAFTDTGNHYITPDFYVFKLGDEWHIVQNEDGLPKLRVSPYYARLLREGIADRKDRDYIKKRIESAAFLIQSIQRRQRTLYRVMKAILDRQRDFFEHGIAYLKPMVLRDVAEDIQVHESTVSRATTNKYVQCPQGIFELKFFFNAAIPRVGGGDVASEAVKARIRQLIAQEDPKKPLSDQAIARLLAQEGLKVARRTVAKYRDEQGILPSSMRKRVF